MPSSCPAIRSWLSFRSVPKTPVSDLPGQIGGTDDAGVGGKCGLGDVHLWPVMSPGQAPLEGRPRGADEQLTRLADAAADNEAAGVEYGRQVGHTLAEPAAHDPEAAQRRRVTLAGCLGYLGTPDRVWVAPGHLEQPRRAAGRAPGEVPGLRRQGIAAGVLLPAAPVSAAAQPPVLYHAEMPRLPCHPPPAAVEPAVQHEACPDAGAHRDEN